MQSLLIDWLYGLKLIQKIDARGNIITNATAMTVGRSKIQASLSSRFANGPSFLGGANWAILYSLIIGYEALTK